MSFPVPSEGGIRALHVSREEKADAGVVRPDLRPVWRSTDEHELGLVVVDVLSGVERRESVDAGRLQWRQGRLGVVPRRLGDGLLSCVVRGASRRGGRLDAEHLRHWRLAAVLEHLRLGLDDSLAPHRHGDAAVMQRDRRCGRLELAPAAGDERLWKGRVGEPVEGLRKGREGLWKGCEGLWKEGARRLVEGARDCSRTSAKSTSGYCIGGFPFHRARGG